MKNVNKIMNMDSVYLRRLYNTACTSFRVENRFVKKGGIVFVGDSITDFCNLDTYYPGLKAVNRGISGDTIEGILGRLDESIFALEPSIVVLLGGANNFAEGYDDVETHIVDTYRSILTQISARLPQAKVIVQSVYPVSDVSFHNRYKFGHGHIAAINQKLEALTKSLGYNYADVFSVIRTGDEEFDKKYTDDGLHPNKNGYAVISEYLRPIIDNLILEQTHSASQENDVDAVSKKATIGNILSGKEYMTNFIEKILVCILLLAVGILFCFSQNAAASITMGVILSTYGIINIIIIGISRRPLISAMGLINAAIIAIGIAFSTLDLATVIINLMPFIYTIAGSLMLIDAFYSYFILKNRSVARIVVFSIFGAGIYSLGMTLLCIHDFWDGYRQFIFGIILCVASYVLLGFTIGGLVIRNKKAKALAQSDSDASAEPDHPEE